MSDNDFSWLEELDSKPVRDWLQKKNSEAQKRFEGSTHFAALKTEICKIVLSTEKLIVPFQIRDQMVRTFHRTQENPKGALLQMPFGKYLQCSKNWESLIDFQELAQSEGAELEYADVSWLIGDRERILLATSTGGRDAIRTREYNLASKKFVEAGFEIPESRSRTIWKNRDQLITSFDHKLQHNKPGAYSTSINVLDRGKDISLLGKLYEARQHEKRVYVRDLSTAEGFCALIHDIENFYQDEKYLVDENLNIIPLKLPRDLEVHGVNKSYFICSPNQDCQMSAVKAKAGSVVILDRASLLKGKTDVITYFEFSPSCHFQGGYVSKSGPIIHYLENVQGRIGRLNLKSQQLENLCEKESITISGIVTSSEEEFCLVVSEGATAPKSISALDTSQKSHTQLIGTSAKAIAAEPNYFSTEKIEVKQHWITALDSCRVPYTVIGPKESECVPTLLYGYGGFASPVLPIYNSILGKVWLEKGFRYVIAHLRGGAEFGPEWHEQAKFKNRIKVYRDFAAIADDLIAKKLTTADMLGIYGRSNGGLLVGATMVLRPELFSAVLCGNPLLDMLNYHRLSVGHIWVGEYGHPEDPDMRPYLQQYSPFQNLKSGVDYPPMYTFSATSDDRVHPAHGRKMMAKLDSLGQSGFYFEATNGGHASALEPEQIATMRAYEWAFLYENLTK